MNGLSWKQMIQPVDWEHPSAFRFEQIRQSDYIAFEPVEDPTARAAIWHAACFSFRAIPMGCA